MLPALIASFFVGLLIVALVAVIINSFLFTRMPPLRRSAFTAVLAWATASAAVYYQSPSHPDAIWRTPLILAPFAIIVWLLMWRSYALYWQDDAAEEDERQWPAFEHEGEAGSAPAAEAEAPRSWMVRHWRGEIPLPVAYWVNSVLVVFLVTVLVASAVRGTEAAGAPLQLVAIAALFFLLFTLLLWVWGAVGTWRSATRHEDHGGSGVWAIVAQVMIVAGAFLTFLQTRGMAFQGAEFAVLAMGGDSLGEPAEVALVDGGTAIRIDGLLTSGTSGRFRALARSAPGLRRVLLDSPGGRQMEAMRIASTVEARGLDTRAERLCLSACTFVLLAGRDRSADPSARIGFHQPSFPGWSEPARRTAIARMAEDYRAAGLDAAFVDKAMITPPEYMWMPGHEALAAARVLTSTEIETSGRPRIFRDMAALADRLNAQLPARVDPVTEFQSAEAFGPVLVHNFTSLRMRREIELLPARVAIGRAAQRHVCAVPSNREALQDGASFVFVYSDRASEPMFQITVDHCPGRS